MGFDIGGAIGGAVGGFAFGGPGGAALGAAGGGLFGGGGGSTGLLIPRSKDEKRALKSLQNDILSEQLSLAQDSKLLNDSLMPFFLEELGFRQTTETDRRGNETVTGIEKIPLSEGEQRAEDLSKQIELGFLERTDAALRGDLPVNPALLSDLSRQEEDLRESLRKQLGSGFETSSAGIEALGRFNQSETEILENARRGDLTLAEQLGIARGTFNSGQQQLDLSNMLGTNALNTSSQQGFNAAAGTNLNLLNHMLSSRSAMMGIGTQASQFDANQSNQSSAGFGQLAGALLSGGSSSGSGSVFANIFGV